MSNAETIVVIIAAGIGDLVLATPALRALRRGHPSANIHLLTNSQAMPLAENLPYITRAWPFPVRDIVREHRKMIGGAATLARLRALKPDMCVNLFRIGSPAGSKRMKIVFAAVGASNRVGHDAFGFGAALTVKAPEDFFEGRHVSASMLEMAKLAGGVPDDAGADVFWNSESECKWSARFDELTEGGAQIVGLNPGGDRRSKRWGTNKFADAADIISGERNIRAVVFGGPGEESSAESICSSAICGELLSLAGKLTLSDLAYAMSRIDLLITSDSGPMHIAAAAGAHIVALFGPDDPALTNPLVSPGRSVVIRLPLDCSPCFSDCEHASCMEGVTARQAADAAIELLDRRRAEKDAPSS